jgi:UDP:flavonoid glycosyltransferase YjiC (YdhE family)
VHALQDWPANAFVEGVLPSHLIMPRVDLAVTAGGQGSVQCAMASGTPLLGIPLQPEQDLNVDLLQKQGAARLVSMRDAVTPELGRVVMQMIATAQFAQNARRIQEIYRRVDGPGACAEAILELINLRPASDARSADLKAAAARA